MMKIAVVGATGPTGIHLVTELRKTVASVRVIARRLARVFPEVAVEKWPADVLDADATLRAIEGCDLVYDCIGLPGDQMHLHPVTARNIAGALGRTKARCVQVSSYWAYYPQVQTEMKVIPASVGRLGCVTGARPRMFYARLAPPFYICRTSTGPVSTSVRSKMRSTRRPPAKPSTGSGGRMLREYIYVPDAMRIAVEIGARTEAFGAHWCLPGSGPLSGQQVADIAGRYLGRQVKLRSAGMTTLRIVGLFNKDLRGLLQVAPDYMKSVRYGGGKLQGLLGPQPMTSYDAGMGHTLAWIASRH
jgi:nucleoside-diphosphate-sugar epimerase